MAQSSEQGCGICRDLKRRTTFPSKTVVFSEMDLFDIPSNMNKKKKKELKKQKAEEFLKYVNAFMNEGVGIVCLHVKNIHLLGIFEQSVNPSMADMIPDNTTFSENFERHLLGKNHVVFRVKPRERGKLLSTYSFNTKISLDCGLEDAGHDQMRYLMKPQMDTDEELYKVCDFKFREGEEVVVKIRKTRDVDSMPQESVFQEGKSIQAKRVMNTGSSTFESFLESDFFDERKPGTYLPKYISAFSKLPRGGSIFLGIKEDKTETPKWEEVDEREKSRMLELKDQSLHLWKDKEGQYYVAKECLQDVVESGEFKCEGIQLTEAEHETVLPTLKRLIKEKMSWLPHQNTEQPVTDLPDLVNVHFHDVEGAVDKVVVEIQVKRYQGVAFLTTDGPRAYCFSKRPEKGDLELKSMERDLWLKKLCEPDMTDRDLSSSTGSSEQQTVVS